MIFTLVKRDGSSGRETQRDGITLGGLRTLLEGCDEMDEKDEFRAGPTGKTAAVRKGDEKEHTIKEGMEVAIIPLRSHLIVTDAKGTQHSVYVEPDETIAAARKRFDWVTDADLFVADGKEVGKDNESHQYLRGVKSLTVKGLPPPSRGLQLLLLNEHPPCEIPWPDGSLDKKLSELRAFLDGKGKADNTAFLNAGGTQISLEMEPYEPVKLLGECDSLGHLRIRFDKHDKPEPDDVQPNGQGEGEPAPRPATDGDGKQPRVTLQEARDLLKTAFGRPIAGTGPPQDVFTRMPKDEQNSWLASMRHLHGLRFVQGGEDGYELERSPCAALSATTRVAVVLPVTSARFMASASEDRTADSVASFTSWNVGADGGVEGKKGSFSLKSNYEQKRETRKLNAGTKVFLRAEYLVARGEIVIDPRKLQLDTQLLTEVDSMLESSPGADVLARRLARLLASYGTHVPLRTIFGGKLIYRNEREVKSGETSDQLTREFSAKVKGSYKSVTAAARGGYKSVDTIQKAWEYNDQAIEVTAAGGNPALALDPYAWAATLSHAGWWSTIAFADVIPLLSLLSESQLTRLKPLLTSELRQKLPGPVDWDAYQNAILAKLVESTPATGQVVPTVKKA